MVSGGDERAAIGELDVLVVAVEAGGPVAAGAEAVGGDEVAGVLDLAAEVRGVQAAAEDRLVHLAQVGEGELVGEQAVRDAAVADLVAQAPEGVLDDLVVVEGEPRERVPRRTTPRSRARCRRVSATGRRPRRAHERPVDDRDDAGGGAVDGAERVELLEVARREAGGLGEGAGCRGVQALGRVEPAARKRPQALVRVAGAPHEREDDAGARPSPGRDAA